MSNSISTCAAREAKNQRAASVPDGVQQVVQRDEGPGALGHRDLDAVDRRTGHPADEQHLEVLAVVAHRLRGVPVARHRPVVVHAPDVDQVVEATAELLGDVPDVGREVRRATVGAVDDAVLVVAERRRPEPEGAVLLVDVAGVRAAAPRRARPSPRRAVTPRVFQTSNRTPRRARLASIIDRTRSAAQRPTTRSRRRRPSRAPSPRPDVLRDRRRQLLDVGALVPVLGHGLAAPDRPTTEAPEVLDLGPRVVEVVLARDVPGRPPRAPGTAGRRRTPRARCPPSADRSGSPTRTPR